MISTANTTASDICVEMYALAMISITPSSSPPSRAPGIEPIPPNTAAVNALMPGMEPVVGTSVGYAEQSSTPATAARPEPMANVMEIVASTLIPMSRAASLSSEQARIALPILVLPMKSESATMMTTHTAIVTSATYETRSSPPKRAIPVSPPADLKKFGNTTGLEPQSSSAAFWRK